MVGQPYSKVSHQCRARRTIAGAHHDSPDLSLVVLDAGIKGASMSCPPLALSEKIYDFIIARFHPLRFAPLYDSLRQLILNVIARTCANAKSQFLRAARHSLCQVS